MQTVSTGEFEKIPGKESSRGNMLTNYIRRDFFRSLFHAWHSNSPISAMVAQNTGPNIVFKSRTRVMETAKKTKQNSTDFRRLLQDELVARCKKNPRYSLRAFAKSLGIYHATLSALIAGRRPLTKKAIKNLAPKILKDSEHIRNFIEFEEGPETEYNLKETYRELTIDTFLASSEWYHDAILELVHIKGFNPTPKWIAKRLGITTHEANDAVERLIRLERLKIMSSGKWIDISRDSTAIIDSNFTSLAAKKYQMKMLELSKDAVENIDISLRNNTSMTMAIRIQDLEEIKRKIKFFRRSLTKFAQRSGVIPDEVYSLVISFFPNSIPEESE